MDFLFFWGYQVRDDGQLGPSCLSQWWPASFDVDGASYASAEHFMMAEKARLFGDETTRRAIGIFGISLCQSSAGTACCASSSACAGNQAPAAGSTAPQSGSKAFCASPVTFQGLYAVKSHPRAPPLKHPHLVTLPL